MQYYVFVGCLRDMNTTLPHKTSRYLGMCPLIKGKGKGKGEGKGRGRGLLTLNEGYIRVV